MAHIARTQELTLWGVQKTGVKKLGDATKIRITVEAGARPIDTLIFKQNKHKSSRYYSSTSYASLPPVKDDEAQDDGPKKKT
jgi:hypothetical protein